MSANDSLIDNLAERWGLERRQMCVLLGNPGLFWRWRHFSVELSKRLALIYAISIGLGALFNEDSRAERDWLNMPREEFGGKTSLQKMLSGNASDIKLVHRLMARERNLS